MGSMKAIHADPHPRLLRLSVHASSLPDAPADNNGISPPQASWPGKIIAGLGLRWSSWNKSSNVQPSRSMVVSAAGNYLAVIDGYQITFLSRANGFEEAIGSSRGPLEAGLYMCGAWLEAVNAFAVVTSLNCIVVLNLTGKELSRTFMQRWKTNSHALGMFANQRPNIGSGERYVLAVLASDCTIYQIEYGPEGLCETNSRSILHASLKKMYPQEVICHDYNCDKSILALAGLSRGSTRSAGYYCLSLWRIQEFWKSVELLGYVDDLERDNPPSWMASGKVSCDPHLKLIMSPACHNIGLLDSGRRLQLVCLKQAPGWHLKKMRFPSRELAGRSVDMMLEGKEAHQQGAAKTTDSSFSCFEVVSELGSVSELGFGSQFESLSGIREACWWSEDALALMKEGGLFSIAYVPDLRMVSKFTVDFSCDKLLITHGIRRRIFVLESIQEELRESDEGIQTMEKSKKSSWRLVSLQEHTVTELFKTLLEDAEFDFALFLAERYNLERESVYKGRWLRSDSGLEAVQEILPRIEDRIWVLKECLERICPSIEAMNGLLQHGLGLVDLCVGSGRLKHATQDALVGRFCLTRLRLLQYSDRLETFLGLSMGRYNSKDYIVFRSSPLPDVALKLAESGKTGALGLLYKRHMYSLTPCLFKMLDAIPETIAPHNYAQLLPQSRQPHPYIAGRERDWVEEEGIVQVIEKYDSIDEEVSPVRLQDSTEHVVKACIGFVWPLEEEIAEWYKRRAGVIDRVSGQLENALTLLDLGKQKGLTSLGDLWEDLSTLHWVIYNNSEADDDMEMNLSLQGWQQLTNYEKFQAMLKGVNESNVLDRLREKGVPFMNHKTSRKAPSVTDDQQEQEESLLVKWMKEIARKNQLQICAIIFMEACKVSVGSNWLFESDVECIKAGLDCVYACTGVDQWDLMMSVLSKLSIICLQSQPTSQAERSSGGKRFGKGNFSVYSRSTEATSAWDVGLETSAKEGVYAALDRKIQQAIGHVEAGRLLSQHQVPKPIGFFEMAQNDERSVKQLIVLILSKFGRRQPARSDAEWASMWDDLQRLQAKAFTFLNRQFLFLEYFRGLLKAGKFSLAKSQLKVVGNGLLSLERAEAVIIQAAREYFYSASSLDSPEIEKARLCLNLVPESKSIAAEMGLIDAVTMKLPALGVSLLPMQFRQVKDPMEIVKKALMSSSAEGDLKVDDVLDIARLLGMNTEDHTAMVEEAIAREAAASGRIALALDLCLGLMKKGYGAVWDLCAALARGPELEGINLQSRKELLGFALSHCDDTSIGQLLSTWKEIDLSKRCIDIRKAMGIEAPCTPDVEASFEEGLNVEAKSKNLQQQEGPLPESLRQSLCKVTHRDTTQDPVDETFFLKERKRILHSLCSQLPWLLQAAGMESMEYSRRQQDDDGLISKSVATILLGLAHTNLLPRDELICHLALAAMLKLSKDLKSLIGCGYLLNLADCHGAVDLFEKEMQHREDLKEVCEVMNLALKYGLLQDDAPSPSSSPKQRRERLLMALRQSNHSTVSGILEDNSSESGNVFWKQWQSKVLQKLNIAEHALELEPIVASFKMDQFVSGDEDYLKDAILSLVESAMTKESSEPEHESRVYRYQGPAQSPCFARAETGVFENLKLNMHVLQRNYEIFKKYLKYLNVKDKWVAVQTLMSVTATTVLENKGDHDKDDWEITFCSLLNFWVAVFEDALEDADKDPGDGAVSRQEIEALLELRNCCKSFERLVQKNAVQGLQAQEVIAKVASPSRYGEVRERFLKAMVSSGCFYQTVVFVWQSAIEELKEGGVYDSAIRLSEISNIYVQVVSSSIETCSVSCRAMCPDECSLQLETAIKAVSSLSSNLETADESLQQGQHLLQEVRLGVWETLRDFAENLTVPPPLRVCLLKLREAIISGQKQAAASNSFDDCMKKYSVTWIGWDITSLAGEKTSSFQHTIVALKSAELISAVWQDVDVKAEDLVSVEAATSVFNALAAKVELAQHAALLTRVLEGWADIFGWETNASEDTIENMTSEEENVNMHAEWSQADGWDDVWEESEEPMENSASIKRDCGIVHSLHVCWKIAFEKLAFYGELDKILHDLDKAQSGQGRTLLTKEESVELVSRFAQESPISAFKVSLLLPYKDAQNLALERFDNKIRATILQQKESEMGVSKDGSRMTAKEATSIDDCLFTLLLASGRLSTWADDPKFSASFCSLCAAIISSVQTATPSSAFTLNVVLPFFVASLTPTSQFAVASALVLQFMRVHPALITWNAAYVALDKFLNAKASLLHDELDISPVSLGSLSCISNTVHQLQSQLKDTLDSALRFLSKNSL